MQAQKDQNIAYLICKHMHHIDEFDLIILSILNKVLIKLPALLPFILLANFFRFG